MFFLSTMNNLMHLNQNKENNVLRHSFKDKPMRRAAPLR
jgi:hypothetical protein